MTSAPPLDDAQARDLDLARDGDQEAFARLLAPWRRELQAHCYRMLGSVHDAEDVLQEVLLRVWKGLAGFEGRSSLRAWLYTVATNASLDAIARRGRRALPVDLGPSSPHAVVDSPMLTEQPWLSPTPDASLTDDRLAPDARYTQRESVELAFVAALQHLPGNQRAALLLFEVLGFPAAEIAEVMGTSTASVNSALQRARKIVAEKVPADAQQRTLAALGDEQLRILVGRYTAALEHGDADGLLALLTEDVSWAMPPMPHWYAGRDAVADFLVRMPLPEGWRHIATSANGQPAVACYRWVDGAYRGFCLDVLTLRGDKIAAVDAFIDPSLVEVFGLPAELPADTPGAPTPRGGVGTAGEHTAPRRPDSGPPSSW